MNKSLSTHFYLPSSCSQGIICTDVTRNTCWPIKAPCSHKHTDKSMFEVETWLEEIGAEVTFTKSEYDVE